MSTTGLITRRMIADRRRSIIWWTVGASALTAIMAAAFVSVRDTGDVFDDYIESLPEGLQEAFGLAGTSIASPEGYLVSQLYSNMYPIVLLILGLGLAAWAVAGAESEGTLELVMANPVSRVRIAVERIVGMALILAFVTAVSTAVLVVTAPPFGLDEGLPWWGLWGAGLQTFAFVMVIACLGFAVGAGTGSKGGAIAAGAGLATAGFLVQALAPIAEPVEKLRAYSPWYWLLQDNPVTTAPNLVNTALPLAVATALVAVGVVLFDRRDVRG